MNDTNTILQYLLESGICLICFYGIYHLFLRGNTFFRLNRLYMIVTSALAMLLPLMEVGLVRGEEVEESALEGFVIPAIVSGKELVQHPAIQESPVHVASAPVYSMESWLLGAYVAGVLLFLVKLICQIYFIQRVKGKRNGNIIESDEMETSSFLNRIFLNPRHLGNRELILKHEQAHIDQYHSVDIIYFELLAILQWFNPIIFLYKKSIRELHEYLADKSVVEQSASKYQYCSLISQEAGIQTHHHISNPFASLIKKRLIMLSSNPSRKRVLLRYMSILPVFVILFALFSCEVSEEYDAMLQETPHQEGDTYELFWGDLSLSTGEFAYSVPYFSGNIEAGNLQSLVSSPIRLMKNGEKMKDFGDQSLAVVLVQRDGEGNLESDPRRWIMNVGNPRMDLLREANEYDIIGVSKVITKYRDEYNEYTDEEALLTLQVGGEPIVIKNEDEGQPSQAELDYGTSHVVRQIQYLNPAEGEHNISEFSPLENPEKFTFLFADKNAGIKGKSEAELKDSILKLLDVEASEKDVLKYVRYVIYLNPEGEVERFYFYGNMSDAQKRILSGKSEEVLEMLQEEFEFHPAQHSGERVRFRMEGPLW